MVITQRQIALEANVSRSTVAAILANRRAERFSEDVRNRVLETAKKHGYRPNRYARTTSSGKSGYVGILGFGMSNAIPYLKLKIAAGILQRENYDPIVQETSWYAGSEGGNSELLVQKMLDARVEGVLLVHPPQSFTQSHLEGLLDASIPVVSIGGEHLGGISAVLSDRAWGYRRVTEHLLSLGYKRLALMRASEAGEKGFMAAIHAHSGKLKPPLIINPRDEIAREEEETAEQFSYRLGWAGMHRALAATQRPEAVVCVTDRWAVGAIRACAEAGVKVPQEMALTGFENDPMGAYGAIPLTTLDHPVREIACRATDLLLAQIRDGQPPTQELATIRGTLVIRQSCGASLINPAHS